MSNPPLPDRDEILRAVRRIAAPDQVVELRALNVVSAGRRPVTLSGYFDDFEGLATAAAGIRNAQGVYITLNPPAPAVLARCANRVRVAGAGAATSDADIIARRWLRFTGRRRRLRPRPRRTGFTIAGARFRR